MTGGDDNLHYIRRMTFTRVVSDPRQTRESELETSCLHTLHCPLIGCGKTEAEEGRAVSDCVTGGYSADLVHGRGSVTLVGRSREGPPHWLRKEARDHVPDRTLAPGRPPTKAQQGR